jgi:hypothetical protein
MLPVEPADVDGPAVGLEVVIFIGAEIFVVRHWALPL